MSKEEKIKGTQGTQEVKGTKVKENIQMSKEQIRIQELEAQLAEAKGYIPEWVDVGILFQNINRDTGKKTQSIKLLVDLPAGTSASLVANKFWKEGSKVPKAHLRIHRDRLLDPKEPKK